MAGGPPPQEQIDATLAWVTDVFREHYRAAPPPLPPRHGRREFGFLWTGQKFFLRHVGFAGAQALHGFLVKDAPHHCYYSTAYYKTPGAATMKEKEWLGADLIFDLDADHLPDADKMTFEQQLVEVKKQARKLLHEFLLGDFGFAPEHVRVVFSGGRGYHFHVTDPRVLQLDSAARREIVDYISPNETVRGALVEEYVTERAWSKDNFGVHKDRAIPKATDAGWNGLLTRTIVRFLEEVDAMDEDAAIAALMEVPGIGATTAREIKRKLTTEHIRTVRDEGRFPIAALANKKVLAGLVQMAAVRAEGETDEPVTADVKRLIRLPGSLHGKTGLRVTPMSIEDFERFDPLRDAAALGDAPTRVIVSKPIEVPLKGARLKVEPGEQELPLYAAMFAALRRSALRPMP